MNAHTVSKAEGMDYEVNLPDIRVNSTVEDFRKMFVSRYEKLRKIVSLSGTMRGSMDTGKEPVYVASLSDIHVGSKTFRKDDSA